MNKQDIILAIDRQMRLDRKSCPNFPEHAAGQAGKVVVEAGKILEAAMNFKYDGVDPLFTGLQMQSAAIKTAAQAIRLLMEMNIRQK